MWLSILFYFFKFLFHIGVQVINNNVLLQVYSKVIHLYMYMYLFFFQIIYPFRLLQNIEHRSLCYTVGPCWLSILFIFSINFIGVQFIYNVVLVSAVQQSQSVVHLQISTPFQILFPYKSLQSTEQSSLCYAVGSYQLSILYIVVCICQSQSTNLSPPFPLSNHKFVFYICDSISAL